MLDFEPASSKHSMRQESSFRMTPITELPESVPVVGFGEREEFVRNLVNTIGLPLNNVTRVSHAVETDRQSLTLGSFHLRDGELTFYKRMENLPEVAQLGVAFHELAHANSPFLRKNSALYGTEQNRLAAVDNAITVAGQTLESHIYLNGYHKMLLKALENGDINQGRYLEETNAIMIQLRFTDPKHLREVLESQNTDTADAVIDQLDETLLTLMPQFANKEALDRHIKSLKESYVEKTKPEISGKVF